MLRIVHTHPMVQYVSQRMHVALRYLALRILMINYGDGGLVREARDDEIGCVTWNSNNSFAAADSKYW